MKSHRGKSGLSARVQTRDELWYLSYHGTCRTTVSVSCIVSFHRPARHDKCVCTDRCEFKLQSGCVIKLKSKDLATLRRSSSTDYGYSASFVTKTLAAARIKMLRAACGAQVDAAKRGRRVVGRSQSTGQDRAGSRNKSASGYSAGHDPCAEAVIVASSVNVSQAGAAADAAERRSSSQLRVDDAPHSRRRRFPH